MIEYLQSCLELLSAHTGVPPMAVRQSPCCRSSHHHSLRQYIPSSTASVHDITLWKMCSRPWKLENIYISRCTFTSWTWSRYPHWHTMEEMKFPWHQLEKLMVAWDENDLCRLLRVAQNLIDLKFDTYGRSIVVPPQRILSLHLQSITFFDCEPNPIMDCLNLPALKNFSSESPVDVAALARLIKHSFCHLETLDISINRVNHDFLHLIRLLPSLVQLSLRVPILPSYAMNALHPDIGDTPPLPNLIELSYVGHLTEDFLFGQFIDILASRWQRNADIPTGTSLSKRQNQSPGFVVQALTWDIPWTTRSSWTARSWTMNTLRGSHA